MNILMISTNRLGYPQFVLPIGVAAVASYLQMSGHNVSFLDLCFEEESELEKAIEIKIAKEQPDYIGVGIRNYCTFMDDPPLFFLPFIRRVVNKCKSVTCAPVILGGGGYSNNPEEILEYVNADYGIYGDGEIAFNELVMTLSECGDSSKINGLVYRKGSNIVKNELKFEPDINNFPVIDRRFYDKRYYNKTSELGLKTKEAVFLTRGCPFKCIYCSSKNFYSTNFRIRNPENVIEELKLLIEQGVEEVDFIDFALNLPIGNAEKILNDMLKNNIKIKWSGNIHPYPLKSLSRELFGLMKETGCIHLDFDTITCSEKIARTLKRPQFSKASIIKAAQWCNEFGIPFSHYLLIGGPGETKETVRETLETVELTNPTANPKVVSNVGLIICSNTEIANIALKEKIIKQDDDLLFPPKYYLSSGFNDEVVEVINDFRKKHHDWLFVGIALENQLKRNIKGVVSDKEIDEIPPLHNGDYLPDVILDDLNKKSVNIKFPSGKAKIIIIDSRESGPKAGPWIESVKKYTDGHSIIFYQVSSVEKLRFFVSKDFIIDHISKENNGHNKLVDWESKFAKSAGITDLSQPSVIFINSEGRIAAIKALPMFSLSNMEILVEEMDCAFDMAF